MIKSGGTGLVSDSPHSEHDLGGFGVALDLGSQALNMNVDQSRIGRVPVSPYFLEQSLPSEDLAWPLREAGEKVELQRREDKT